MSEENIPKVF